MERIKDVVVWNDENWIVDFSSNTIYPQNIESVKKKKVDRYLDELKYSRFLSLEVYHYPVSKMGESLYFRDSKYNYKITRGDVFLLDIAPDYTKTKPETSMSKENAIFYTCDGKQLSSLDDVMFYNYAYYKKINNKTFMENCTDIKAPIKKSL